MLLLVDNLAKIIRLYKLKPQLVPDPLISRKRHLVEVIEIGRIRLLAELFTKNSATMGPKI